jgi:hypothetical protein
VVTTGQMKLQVPLGNVQAGVDSGHSVLAHSCKCELALVGRSINGSSLGHGHRRFRLLTHLVENQCQRVANSSAPLSCRLQAAGQSHLPMPLLSDKGRGKFRYKRVRVRCRNQPFNQERRKTGNRWGETPPAVLAHRRGRSSRLTTRITRILADSPRFAK